jgi:hypothetical protein
MVFVDDDDDVDDVDVWRVELGMKGAGRSLYGLFADVTITSTMVGTSFFTCARTLKSDARRWVCELVARASRIRCGLV